MIENAASLTELESRSFDDFDLRAGRSGHVGIIYRGTVGERQRARLGGHGHTFGTQALDRFGQRARGAPSNMVDDVSFAWFRVAALHQDPHVAEAGRAILDGVDAPLELHALPAELRQQPGENFLRVRPTHLDVVQAEQLRILHDFDARPPWVFHERELVEARRRARWRDDLDACCFEFLHLRVEVREREAQVIDGASAARLRVLFP